MKILLLSDIHANLSAFDAVLSHAERTYGPLSIAHLGDAVDYGMRPNETLERLHTIASRLVVNMAGNHERAVLGLDMERFSSARGKSACQFTRSILHRDWLSYIQSAMNPAPQVMSIEGHRVLFVHGDLSDPFWGGMPSTEMVRGRYREYEYVICGHTHLPVLREVFYPDDSRQGRRGEKKTIFINPGSVGQPRNHNPHSQYAVVDFGTSTVHFNAVPYDVAAEKNLYNGEVHPFYAERLGIGV